MILQAIHTRLTAQNINNVYPVTIPQKEELPLGAMFVVGDNPNPAKNEISKFNEIALQISSFANTYTEAATLHTQIKTALDGYRAPFDSMNIIIIYDGYQDLYEPENRVYHIVSNYKILKS